MRTGPGRLRAAARQWARPREFRIRPAPWPDDALAVLADLVRAIEAEAAAQRTAVDAPEPAPDTAPTGDGLTGSSAADLATSVWRLRAKLAATPDPPRALVRHVDTAWDTLADAGIVIRDHLHEPFDPGLSISVAAYEATPGLRREEVIETLRPSVFLHGRTLQMGEVIVGTPEKSEEQAAGAEETHTR
ncbi:hypothetical protein BTM25_32820 [Actinomadura rubteroloni]|uniref:Nucleotide exchange factor GrpE n=1 Tax=Actinomadura rubteroloni TaxID=1926885 RepID=A0A2P4UI28_9ACTN|nr:hypothetical protein [Actinomadura rubteroloni]POM24648.1 hypothetical protein BTM25_32820 [Actinomadura rubteroloni]